MVTLLMATLLAAVPQVSEVTVHAGGTEVRTRCIGRRSPGRPLVVLEAGGGNGLGTWSSVQAAIGEFARVCAYNRPTLIRNGAGPRASSSPSDVVQTLHDVLSALGEL